MGELKAEKLGQAVQHLNEVSNLPKGDGRWAMGNLKAQQLNNT